MTDAIEIEAVETRMGREWRVLVNRAVVYEGDATGAKNVKETLDAFACAIARAATAEEREACALLCEIESEDYAHQGPRLACRALAKSIRSHASEDR